MSVDVGQILVAAGRAAPAQVEKARQHAQASGLLLDEALVALEVATEDSIADALGRHFGIPALALARLPKPNPRVTRLVPEDFARTHGVVPLERAAETLILLMEDPTDVATLALVRKASQLEIQPIAASPATVRRALDTFYMSPERRLLENAVPFVAKLITEEAARAYRALPVDREGSLVTVAMAGPEPEKVKRALEMATGLQVQPVAARWEDVERAINRIHRPPARVFGAGDAAAAAPAAQAPRAPPAAASAPGPTAPPIAAAAPARPVAGPPPAVDSLDDLLGGPPSPAPAPPQPRPAAAQPAASAGGGMSLDSFLSSGPTPPPAISGPPPPAAHVVQPARSTASGPASLDDLLATGTGSIPVEASHGPGNGKGNGKSLPVPADDGSNGPNLGAAGGPDGPKTALKVEASTRDTMKALASKTWGDLDRRLAKLIPEKVARNYRIVVTGRLEKTLYVALENPKDRFAIETVEFLTRLHVDVAAATPEQIDAGLEVLYVEDVDEMAELWEGLDDVGLDDVEMRKDLEDLADLDAAAAAEAAPVVKFVNLVIDNALKARASDIHLEIYEDAMRIRYRVDGVLREVMRPPIELRDPVISRVKIMGKMDISERRLPQDGRLRLRKGPKGQKKDIDFRISTVPTIFGEKIVMRILDRAQVRTDLTELGFEQQALDWVKEAIHKPYGMVLVVGPSGSGKTNTLYSALADVNTPEVNVITCEDPVEFATGGLNQVQARESIGLSFATALRSFLRQDPNIIFVGEIRDFETAEIAVKAALTGHLVMSTLHTNDAPACINRLTNMGVEPFLIATSLHLVVAQRLVRRICVACKEIEPISVDQLVQMGFAPEDARGLIVHKGRGCVACENTGYLGRVGLYEVLRLTNEMREMILFNGSATEIKELAMRQGMRTLRQSGLQKIRDGVTSCEEVVRETIG